MKKIELRTTSLKMLADLSTPVGIYLRLRDRFRDTILLESADYHGAENSYSFIGINAIAGIEVSGNGEVEYKLPAAEPAKLMLDKNTPVPDELWKFMQHFECSPSTEMPQLAAQGLYGYTSYDAVSFFENLPLKTGDSAQKVSVPVIRYRLYQFVIAINHFKNELFICENHIRGIEGNIGLIQSIIQNKDVPVFPFKTTDTESSNLEDSEYIAMVKEGKKACARGDVFQIVLSRQYSRPFHGDEFNVYRALRNINPSPYLFYFDYGDYRIFGSSPESQLIVKNQTAVVHPIAGTFRRTGNATQDEASAAALLKDKKENAEHVMLVDLARNDLSRSGSDVHVSRFCEVQYFSHVIHLVSEVKAKVKADANPFRLLADTFPAGTLSGAPKYKAMQLIDGLEKDKRGYYGGCIGFIGFNGRVNQAILIRSFLSRNNCLTYRAGAGVTISSDPQSELKEVNNKLSALTAAIESAEQIG